jgi:hypothetical protein
VIQLQKSNIGKDIEFIDLTNSKTLQSEIIKKRRQGDQITGIRKIKSDGVTTVKSTQQLKYIPQISANATATSRRLPVKPSLKNLG